MTVEPRLSGVCCCMHGFIALVPKIKRPGLLFICTKKPFEVTTGKECGLFRLKEMALTILPLQGPHCSLSSAGAAAVSYNGVWIVGVGGKGTAKASLCQLKWI